MYYHIYIHVHKSVQQNSVTVEVWLLYLLSKHKQKLVRLLSRNREISLIWHSMYTQTTIQCRATPSPHSISHEIAGNGLNDLSFWYRMWTVSCKVEACLHFLVQNKLSPVVDLLMVFQTTMKH